MEKANLQPRTINFIQENCNGPLVFFKKKTQEKGVAVTCMIDFYAREVESIFNWGKKAIEINY